MARLLTPSIAKLAAFGEMAGFSLDEMFERLEGGLSFESLLYLVESNLETQQCTASHRAIN
jgi:hypothetical protein